MTQDELSVILQGVAGWLGVEEAYHLYTLASQVTDGVIVEIGAYHGRSTLALGHGASIHKTYVYSIDPHHNHEQGGIVFDDNDGRWWMENVIEDWRVAQVVKPVFLPSELVGACWDIPIGLLFIDGIHDNVASDFNYYSAWLTPAGRVAMHDSTGAWDAPTALVNFLCETGAWQLETQIGYTSVLKRGTNEPE